MTSEEYREVYLRSPHWATTRKVALERAERRCQVCNAKDNLDVHHRTYERLGEERPADLTVLCRRCHDLFHGATTVTKLRAKPRPMKSCKRRSKSKRKAQYRADNRPGAHATAMAQMRARNEARDAGRRALDSS